MRRIPGALLLLGLFASFANSLAHADDGRQRVLEFDVFLDGSKIGYHRYTIDATGPGTAVSSEARFDVRFLFLTAFRYRHETMETWADGCLAEIDARTDSNGKAFEVRGVRTDTAFVVDAGDEARRLPECVMTFAYWNPVFLEQSRLLNPQTGEYLDVDVEELGRDTIKVGDRRVPARSVRISARELQVTLWYSDDAEWLALESMATGGRILRYELA